MGRLERPEQLKAVIFSGDLEHLSRAGTKGAEETNRIKKKQRERTEAEKQLQKEDFAALQASTNENVLDSDGQVLEPDTPILDTSEE